MVDKKSDKNILEELIGGIRQVSQHGNQEKLMEKVDNLRESEKSLNEKIGKDSARNAVGVDIGTCRVVSMKYGDGGQAETKDQLNAFLTMPNSPVAIEMLKKNNMKFINIEKDIAVLGYDAQVFANIFNSEVRRPMEQGLLKPDETSAIPVLKEIVRLIVDIPKMMGTNLCFSVPAPQIGFESDLVFHESILKKYFESLGFNTKSITEGTAVVLSELANDNYTGIGISMGAGMCNICFSFLSVPVIVFSLPQGGDNIDIAVARVANATRNRVRVLKEEGLDLAKPPSNKIESAFHIYYEDALASLLNHLSAVFSQAENLPRINHAIPIVLAGGTCMPNGFKALFEKLLKKTSLPVKVSEVKMASDVLKATARGAFINASV